METLNNERFTELYAKFQQWDLDTLFVPWMHIHIYKSMGLGNSWMACVINKDSDAPDECDEDGFEFILGEPLDITQEKYEKLLNIYKSWRFKEQ